VTHAPPARPSRQSASALEGNGVRLVREVALAARIQKGLERLYQLERVVDVEHFMEVEPSIVQEGANAGARSEVREALFVRETHDGIEMSLRVPELLDGALDRLCQIIEGVSHFVYVADRAARDQSTTQLELELQAEVDKYVVICSSQRTLDVQESANLRKNLFENASFVDAPGTEEGERYRLANTAAQRFVRRLEKDYLEARRLPELRQALREFYQMGLAAKLREARM
jgi:hypothetical protein